MTAAEVVVVRRGARRLIYKRSEEYYIYIYIYEYIYHTSITVGGGGSCIWYLVAL